MFTFFRKTFLFAYSPDNFFERHPWLKFVIIIMKDEHMQKRLNFAIVGCGRISWRHAEHIHHYGQLIAVCDVEKEKANVLAAHYNCSAYYSIDDLLSANQDIDVVVICTPNGLHAQQSILALNASFHVLCEKPMAIKAEDCYKMIEAANRNDKKLFVVKQNRFNPPVVAVKEALNKGVLGKILSFEVNCFWNRDESYYHNSWKGTKEMDGGTLFTQFSHFIDLMYWFAGDVKNVFAVTRNIIHKKIIEFEDTGIVTFECLNGAIGSLFYTVNSYKKNMEGSLTLFCEKGTVKIGGQYLNELEYQSIQNFSFENIPQGNPPNHYGNYVGSMSNHDKVYERLIDVLQNNMKAKTNAVESAKTVEIIEKIYAAAKTSF